MIWFGVMTPIFIIFDIIMMMNSGKILCQIYGLFLCRYKIYYAKIDLIRYVNLCIIINNCLMQV